RTLRGDFSTDQEGGRANRIFLKRTTSRTLALLPRCGHVRAPGFEDRHDVVAAANDDLAEWAKQRLVASRSCDRSDADRRTEHLVGGLKPGGNSYGIAMSRIVQLDTNSHIADDGWSSLEANARASKADRRDLGAVAEDL